LLTYNFVLIYLLFPSTSAAIFATFQCEVLDDPAKSNFLRIDFAVDCKTAFHKMMQYYAGLMILVYPIGVPALYAYLLFYRHRTELLLLRAIELKRFGIQTDEMNSVALSSARVRIVIAPPGRGTGSGRSEAGRRAEARSQVQLLEAEEERRHAALPDYVQKLILGYELRTYYFELIECFRKLAVVCEAASIELTRTIEVIHFQQRMRILRLVARSAGRSFGHLAL
jgi:hypothetical protein